MDEAPPPRSRLEQRQAAYELEFGELEKKHRDDYKAAQYVSFAGLVLCGVAIGRWWHPFIAFAFGIGWWRMVKEMRKKCDVDAQRRQLYGVE